ncbi:hypothetical protein [Sphingopyxis terrae]|nr:hypothetical protein [Sphingopyxis terrae]PCF91057.1 hypothetical protein CPA46_11450 [Sphingopyxis terrae subsp. ummariensis]
MWLLSLLDAAERMGIAPLSVERLHRLVYLANAMAPVYDLLTPDGYLLKYKRGPFFPEVQWDVDRLCAQGLVGATELKTVHDELGWWFQASYSLTRTGMVAVDQAMHLDAIGSKATFLREVVRAFAAILRKEDNKADEADAVLLEDVTYAHADSDAPIDFNTAADNLTALAANEIAKRVSENELVGRREKVHLYFRYLDRVWDVQKVQANG